MERKPSITGCVMNAALEMTLAVELFLNENYRLHQYPSVDINHGNKVRVGQAMTTLGYESADHSNVPFYKVIPLKAA